MVPFAPDYRHILAVMANRQPARLPLYEHIISPGVMERILGRPFAGLLGGAAADRAEFFRRYCEFFVTMTYDVASYEVCITSVLPGDGALCGGQGQIQTRADLESYPWDELPSRYAAVAAPALDAFVAALPPGMKGIGGVGNGVFEISEDLVGLEYLPFMQVDDPELYRDLYTRIGEVMVAIWSWFLPRYGEHFAACRVGDDLGFKSSLLTNPTTVRDHILPQYRRVIQLVHGAGKPFLWHSCGCIFEVMDAFIDAGIDAKHSNEDAVAPFGRWIEDYGSQIGLLGGFDMDFLCGRDETQVYEAVLDSGTQFRAMARGYALGSGNSIPDYVPVENYLAMVRAGQQIRANTQE